ncbi:winged helix domain-containing protein [Roseobacter ponti]|uniref:Winged helix domain-containing protein n=1 Tax=Roseobacter ponti TaxID=1891787 RepID=A0A858SVF5_9RHOB|nr:hypothetical protein [Roseobacter ponti]QJF51978.1 hypothetical protein G3256_12795 [Roseobacter ponti]
MKIHVTLNLGEQPRSFNLNGRLGWAFFELHKAGKRGVTPIERPAPRWSGYVHDLRGMGIAIDTEMVPHGGTYSGHHARYRLACDAAVRVLA